MALAADSLLTSDAILDATDAVLGKYGLKKLTMEDVANAAGVSRRTIYEYFPSKKDLVLASIDRVVDRAQTAMEIDASTNYAAPERIYRMLCNRVMVRVNSVQNITQSLDSMFSEIRADYLARREQYFEREAAMISIVLQAGQQQGAFGKFDPLETASLLVRATNAYLPYSLSVEELGHPEAIQEGIEKLAAILVSGISR